jgi:hypothetical protein
LDAESTKSVAGWSERRGPGVPLVGSDRIEGDSGGASRGPEGKERQPGWRKAPGSDVVTSSRGKAKLPLTAKTPLLRLNRLSTDGASERVAKRNPLQEKMVGAVRFELTTF